MLFRLVMLLLNMQFSFIDFFVYSCLFLGVILFFCAFLLFVCLFVLPYGEIKVYHRLNGSSSPVLTATCLSYGRLCDFLGFFFPNRPGGHTPRPILTQNGSNDVDSRKDVPFGVKIATF